MNLLLAIVVFVLAAAASLAVGLALKWVDRLVTARVQWRVGPPWYQPLADVVKLMGKENLLPATARQTGFLLAPVAAVAATAVAAAVLWYGVLNPSGAFIGDLIVVLYLLAIPAAMTILGASASGNPHAAVGATREIKLLLSYELPLFLAVLVAVSKAGWSFRLGSFAAHGPALYSLSGVIAMLVAVVCMQAKLGLVPFDVAEAECEIMSGTYVEYSGPSLGMFLMSRAMMLAVLPALLVLVFWGGLGGPAWLSVPSFVLKYVLLVALTTLIRNTNPRLRIDQVMKLFWYALTPAAAVALALALHGW